MPPITFGLDRLKAYGAVWQQTQGFEKKAAMDLSDAFASEMAPALAELLGGIPIVPGRLRQLAPVLEKGTKDVVEVSDIFVVGGVRPQHFDVGYRPDGVRIAIDVKTLNTKDSVGKNYPNMINDLSAEATTVHTRFPYALVGFVVAVPRPCLEETQTRGLIRRLEGLGRREAVDGADQLAEAIAFVVWDPTNGQIDPELPPKSSPVRVENFSPRIERIYVERYDGAAPHLAPGTRVKVAAATDDSSEGEAEEEDAG